MKQARRLLLVSTLLLAYTGCTSSPELQPTLTTHVRSVVSDGQAAAVGQLPLDQTMRIDIVLPLRNETELQGLIPQLNDRANPSYHQFLTPEELTARFGPSQQDWDDLVTFAQAQGFQVTGGSLAARDLRLVGTVATIQHAFNLTMRVYQHPTEDRTFYSPDQEPRLALPFSVLHISGLDDYSIPHPQLERRVSDATPRATTGSGPSASFLGTDMRAAYYGGTALTGAGQNIGLFEYYGTDLSDLNTYYTNAGQTKPFTPTLISTDGTSTSCVSPSCDDTEQTLDMTQAMGMAPGMNMLYMYIGSTDTAIISAMTVTSDAPLSKQISCSWGWTPADPSSLNGYWETMAAQGQNFFAASGDSSTWSSSNEAWPADAAYVVSVGGTDLTTTGAGGAWASETAWTDSGGGHSPDSIAIPSWQTSAASTCSSAGLGCSTTLRNGPDVSGNANFTYYVCADQTTCTANDYGGTSFATPMWAGYLALANEQAAANGDSIGFLDPTIYPAAEGSTYSTLFHDITSGTSGSYKAGTGYDLVTGWGSPNTTGLINLLAGASQPSFTLSASPKSVSITQGGAAETSTITVTDAGGFSGSVTLSASGLPSGVTASFGTNPTTGSSVLSLTASSTATTGSATVTISGVSGALSATTTISLTVSAAATPNFTASASPTSVTVTQGASGTSTITITSQNAFASAVTLSASGLPSGVTASFSANPVTPSANGSTTSTLTLTASATAATGTATITITGTSGALSHSTTIALTVDASTGTAGISLALSPSSFTIDDGSTVNTTLTVTNTGSTSVSVDLSVSEFPSGVLATASADPVSVAAHGSTNVTISWKASRRAARETTSIDLIGTAGSETSSIPVTITVAQ
jgi:subtilase family serine protease